MDEVDLLDGTYCAVSSLPHGVGLLLDLDIKEVHLPPQI